MQTDKELLELAALAAGYELFPEWDCAESGIFLGKGCDGDLQFVWDPLEDDGDAFRLAVKLELDLFISIGRTAAASWLPDSEASADGCPRRAIVMCAAEIGRAKRG